MLTALLSAYDKTGVVEFAEQLYRLGFKIMASSGTAKCIEDAGLPVTNIATIVGELILGHRAVTLSQQIHAALLAKDTPDDNAELKRIGIPRIDLVYVDLCPLGAEIAKPNRTLDSVLEMTDVGGPAMLMAAVKGRRLVICDRTELRNIVIDIRDGDWQNEELRRCYAAKAVGAVALYHLDLAKYLSRGKVSGMITLAGLEITCNLQITD